MHPLSELLSRLSHLHSLAAGHEGRPDPLSGTSVLRLMLLSVHMHLLFLPAFV